ncbi:thylakoid membrane photosystem I accumulation factor [Alkalinema sp. FACHB-956]|uniref:thylakoid membrane photosystem I accumulation factor n=1 Tax=Alkalinema sp. FACHB-956 TaxID=2692768 RepID=UPI001684586C|nr:thylakoid membrane photosystem I accumulation factor [Alkalinema sp. FACHB-956]MBD2328959.1 thylakoid membrane photosystem I accumulation factor [Alkalinema sp. FACHB-956]
MSAALSKMLSPLQPLHTLRTFSGYLRKLATVVSLCVLALLFCFPSPAQAALNDDRFDGDIFALYAGNGSLIPPRITLADTIKKEKPAIVVFYADDSSDCKEYSLTVSQLQAFYGRAASFIAIRVDSLPLKEDYEPTEPAYYYQGYIPQTVIFDQKGQVRLDEVGKVPFEKSDDVLREVFDLLPRSESQTLQRRKVNELSTELVPQ